MIIWFNNVHLFLWLCYGLLVEISAVVLRLNFCRLIIMLSKYRRIFKEKTLNLIWKLLGRFNGKRFSSSSCDVVVAYSHKRLKLVIFVVRSRVVYNRFYQVSSLIDGFGILGRDATR